MAFTQVTVTGTYVLADGTPAEGTVRFTPGEPMRNETVVVASPITATLDGAGALSVSLAATTDGDTESESGTPTYLVEELIEGQPNRAYYIPVPHSPSSLDLADVAPASGGPIHGQYLTRAAGDGRYVLVGGGGGSASVLHRLVETEADGYGARPDEGYVDFLGWSDPGAALLTGDTWTEIEEPPEVPTGTEIEDTFTGSNGGNWSSFVWNATIPSGVTCDIQSNQGRLVWSAGTFDEKTRKLAPANSADWRFRGQIATVPSLSGWGLQIVIQATSWGSANPDTGYKLVMDNAGYSIIRRVSNVNTTLVATVSLAGAKWWDFKVVEGVLKYRVWTGTIDDVPSYTTATNSSPITGTGAAGIFFYSGDTSGTCDFRFDNVLIDTAPAP